MSKSKIRDLIEVPPVKTVIQMRDIQDPKLRGFLTESFLLTAEVKQVLVTFLSSICQQQGQGFFLEGNFGSGKSHLLTVSSLLLSYQECWQPLLEQEEGRGVLTEYHQQISPGDYLVINLSLVEHSSRENLEDTVNDGIVDGLELIGDSGNYTKLKAVLGVKREDYRRRDFYAQIEGLIQSGIYQGLVILIDELSEFLRSKPEGRSFNEDIRFLQFLGEFAAGKNCWIMATLQEGIEKTGEINQVIYRKIKDRYRVHFHLTGTHIKEIVNKRLIKKKDGSKGKILEIYRYYADSFADWLVSREEFVLLYPVNPLSIPLLDNLKPLFSQHRGIIDFIHFRLQGDSSRNIPGIMDCSAEKLLNPDLIFDHFLDRIRETMETRRYYEKVYRYYEQEIGSILTEDEVETGLKIIKLLILFAISPVERKYCVSSIAHMLLKAVTDLDGKVNYEYINDILQRLHRHGAYLMFEQGDGPEENYYYLDLKADVNLIIRQKTDYLISNFFTEEQRLFTTGGQLVNESYLPLAGLLQTPRTIRTVKWDRTERQGYLCLLPFTDISLKAIEEFNARLINIYNDEGKPTEIKDFVIFIGYPLKIDEQQVYLKDVVLPELNSQERSSYCFWLPEKLSGLELLNSVLARQLLLEEYQDKKGETALAVQEKLRAMLREDSRNVTELFREAFFNGDIFDGNGEPVFAEEKPGIVSFNNYLEKIAAVLLGRRFPDHQEIAPYQQVISDGQLNKICQFFLETGELDRHSLNNQNLIALIENVLNPLGIVKKKGKKLHLLINLEKNPLLKYFFSCLEEERTALKDLYQSLRKGSYGMSYQQFKILVLALLYSGYITVYSEQQKIALSQLDPFNFERIKAIGYGEIIADDFQEILKVCSLLPSRFKNQPFSLPLQQDIWNFLVDLKREMSDDISNMKVKLTDLTLDGDFDYQYQETLLNDLNRVDQLLQEIKVSYSAEEGLERFASMYRSLPNVDNYFERFKSIKDFLDQGYSTYTEMKSYLQQIPDGFPDNGKYGELKKIRGELLDGIQDQSIIYSSGFLQELVERYNYFRRVYAEEYYAEHHRKLTGDRFQLYHKVEKSNDYQILSQLAEIEMIAVKDDLIKVKRMLARVLRQECNRLNRTYLEKVPVCSCGFKPGDQVESVGLEEIHAVIKRGIGQYLTTLAGSEYLIRIEDYLENMEAVGEKRFARPIRDLLGMSKQVETESEKTEIDGAMITKLSSLLNRNVINRINQALAERVKLLERDLDQLYENLVGRSFSLEQIEQIFRDWLDKGQLIDKYSYIKVISAENRLIGAIDSEQDQQHIIVEFLEKYFPELLSLYDQLGDEAFALCVTLPVWQDIYKINNQELNNLYPWSADLMQKLNLATLYDLWNKLGEGGLVEVKKRFRSNIRNKLMQDNLLEQFMKLMPLADLDDIVLNLEKEFISPELIHELVIILVKRTERGLSVKGADLYLERLEGIIAGVKDQEKLLYLELVKNYLKLWSSLSALEEEGIPDSNQEWEHFYRKNLSLLEYNLAIVRQLAEELSLIGVLPVNNLLQRVKKHIEKYQQEFKKFSQTKLFQVNEQASQYLQREVKDVNGLDLSAVILEKYPEIVKRINREDSYCILLDGMRWDTWDLIKRKLQGNISYRIIEEGSLYANLPSNTATQLERLRESGFRGEIYNPDEYPIPEKGRGNQQKMISEIIKFSYIDDKIHTSKQDYQGLMEEIAFQTHNRLLPFLKKLPNRTTVLLVSDHGYRINQNFSRAEKYETARYLHGGETPFELIVPWALLYLV